MFNDIVAGLVVAAVSGVAGFVARWGLYPKDAKKMELQGTPLSALPFYPIQVGQDGSPVLDKSTFMEAVRYLLSHSNTRAASDLMYLGDANHDSLALSTSERAEYRKLEKNYRMIKRYMGSFSRQRREVFSNYKRIVEGIGDTIRGVPIEIVLHDTRDPLHSVVAIRNTITGRKIDSPTTDFGVRLIKFFGRHGSVENQVGYRLRARDGREIKSSTIPLEHDEFGLVGFICINIDLSAFSLGRLKNLKEVLELLVETPMGWESEQLFPTTIEPPSPALQRTRPAAALPGRIDGFSGGPVR